MSEDADLDFQDVNLDQHLMQEESFEDSEQTEEDPVLAGLTPEEKALLAKIQKKQEQQDFVLQTFMQLENRPTDEQIEYFKQQVGDVYLISLSEKENFVFRPLKRLEWRTLMSKISKLDSMKQSEAILMKGSLWPKLDQQNINVLTAGSIETVKNMIMQVSNFIDPEVAMQLVRKL